MFVFDLSEMVPDVGSITERVVLSEVTSLEIDAGWRDIADTAQFMRQMREQFDELGYSHIELKPAHKLRRGMVLISGVIYKVRTQGSNDGALRFLRALKSQIEPILRWCEENCIGAFYLDGNGVSFSKEDDYVLFKLKFGGVSSSVNSA